MRRMSLLILSMCLFQAQRLGAAPIAVDIEQAEGPQPRILAGTTPVFTSRPGQRPLVIVRPDGETTIAYEQAERSEGSIRFTSGQLPGASISDTYRQLGPELIERTLSIHAKQDMRYYCDMGWEVKTPGKLYSFAQEETADVKYSPGCSGPEFGGGSLQTFPFVGVLSDNTLYGVIGDTPGLWQNRSFLEIGLDAPRFSLLNGDGSKKRVISIPTNLDATTVYRATFDGWQHIEAGEKQEFKSWIFSSPAQSHYDVQLAAHLALANAKGFNNSSLEAILRNTSYLLLRRNLLRPESDYIFISGVGYGWKQWVTDGFYMSRGLDMPQYDASAHAGVFYERIDYEDNAQYYLIWSVLVKRAGGELDMRTVDRAWHFMRANEKDGLFYPPRLKPDHKGFRTYHDMLEYEDSDAPTANQGFHIGALYAARELGYAVSDEEIAKSKAQYAALFNKEAGYFPTSKEKQDQIGQDTLYGEVLTYCVFGEKLLPDDLVKRHLETTMKIQSPFGMRVISKANGDLLDGHSGSYVYGGSWFLNDGANYLDGLIHGMDPAWVDDKLLWRLEKELAFLPAFHESINTLTGKPHGHHLYSWNSGFWWLRRETRARLGMTGPDPLDAMLDNALGVEKVDGILRLKEGVERPGWE